MSGHTPWREISHKRDSNSEASRRAKAELERHYDRPWWRLVRGLTFKRSA
jgi:hypothetical protein